MRNFSNAARRGTNRHKRAILQSCSTAVLVIAGIYTTDAAAQVVASASDSSANAVSSDGLETVTVTARHREENAQNVPISLSVVSGNTLASNGINNSINLPQLVPSLNVVSTNPRNTSILVRGLGANVAITNDGLEAGVGVYVDGVLYARPATSTFDLPDISSVEELRGPQGTLFGKNTVAGALNISTTAPSQTLDIHGSISLGNYNYEKETLSIAGPVTDTLAIGVTGYNTGRGGFDYDIFNGKHPDDYYDNGVRVQALWQPTGDLTVRLIADYGKQHQDNVVSPFIGVATTLADGSAVPRNFYQRSAAAGYTPPPFDPWNREVDDNSPVFAKMEEGGVSAQADWAFGGGFTLTSISAFRFWNWTPSNDVDGTSLSVLTQAKQGDQENEATQELRITSPTGGPIDYTAGLYYFYEDDEGFGLTSYGTDAPIWLLGANNPLFQTALNGFTVHSRSTPVIDSYAGYGQATWHILPALDFTGGFRYTYESKTGSYFQYTTGPSLAGLTSLGQATAIALRDAFGGLSTPYTIHASNGLLGGLATLTYHVTDDFNAYATYSHGEKSAGLNLSNVTTLPTSLLIVKPETIDNYEAGFKSSWFDNRVTVDADAFWEADTDYQTTISDLQLNPPVTYLANIPSVRTRGVEADVNARPTDELELHFSTAYTEGTYQSYPNSPAPFEDYTVVNGKLVTTGTVNLSGERLPLVSKWVFALGGEYHHELGDVGLANLTGYITGDTNYRTSYNSSSNLSIYSQIPGRDITNFSVGVRTDDGHWDLSFWARNASNTKYYVTTSGGGFGNTGLITGLQGDPQTFGATLQVSY